MGIILEFAGNRLANTPRLFSINNVSVINDLILSRAHLIFAFNIWEQWYMEVVRICAGKELTRQLLYLDEHH
jgi:hypothetical protein